MTEGQLKTRPRYCPFYCEENVWHLCADPRIASEQATVAVISNLAGHVALWCHRAADDPEQPVVWDYHVILLVRAEQGVRAWDLDSTLGPDMDLDSYLDATFRAVPDAWAPRFRLVAAAIYRDTLATDRRHMLRPEGGYVQPPPPWSVIGTGSNLARFVDVRDAFAGDVVDLAGVRARFIRTSRRDPHLG